MKYSSIKPAVNFVIKTKFRFKFPKAVDVLIFDKEGSEIFKKYLNSYEIIDVRGESINLWVFIYTLLNFKWSFVQYVANYIKLSSPKLVITYIDNTTYYYELKQKNPLIIFISIQNGWRDDILFDTFAELSRKYQKSFFCDYLLCFGNHVANEYSKHINSNVIPIGSFQSNCIPKNKPEFKRPVIYLSQYRTPVNSVDGLSMPMGKTNTSWDLFYSAEKIVLPVLKNFCKRNNLQFIVCGGPDPDYVSEEVFYRDILGDCDWEFEKRINPEINYHKIDKSLFVAYIDSTLGYEALGRGAKVVAFPIRGNFIQKKDRRFGNSDKYPNDGLFWSSNLNIEYYEKILQFIINVSNEEWLKLSNEIKNDLMQFDQDNTIFKQILNENLKNHVK
jgi:surface carbohydrate biosynthesis protein